MPREYIPDTTKKQRKKRLKVQPGKSIKGNDFNISESEDDPGEDNFNEADTPVDIEMIVNEAKEDQQSSSSNLINVGQMSNIIIKNNIKEGTWVVVKYGETKKLYFVKIIQILQKGELYEGSFTRSSNFSSSYNDETKEPIYIFPDIIDFYIFKLDAIVMIVPPPKSLRRGRMQFTVKLSDILNSI
ncbi:unnamed protein product [Macrosiphum euphorbiae]|uniref:SGF29 C-terminal domain-containing protein n=1 Tax=Macrosiphum euphorbiae TaxID=13131 RepID=A0AAV0Y9P4_9HEMI|nr:unnamed protein product [Macrosiphum euphorbiae]CAI6377699.1 unnamed protein product [Macrosiphum euphorbiae]